MATEKSAFINRDLSWLTFNYRILQEAKNPDVPLLERLKFIAIFSSNLDEFYRVRVAGLNKLVAIDKKKIKKGLEFSPKKVVKRIRDTMAVQLDEYGETMRSIFDELGSHGLHICNGIEKIPASAREELFDYFTVHVMGLLRPVFVGPSKLFLNNNDLYLAVKLRAKGNTKGKAERKAKGNAQEKAGTAFAYVNIPSDQLSRFKGCKSGDELYLVFLDDIIRQHLDLIFPEWEVEECMSIKLNKDADLQIDDEYHGDLAGKIEKHLSKRNLGENVRFLYDQEMSAELLKVCRQEFEIDEAELVAGGRYHNLNDLFQVGNPLRQAELEYAPLPTIRHRELDGHRSLLAAMEERDHILHFPYHSYDYVLRFFNEAAIDPDVSAIYVTFYRMARDSRIGKALLSACQNGKEVYVFMEVKARFDEANNLRWAEMMKAGGVKLVYSMPGLKVHAKVAQVRKGEGLHARYYGFFGTGNLNEKTAKLYCDHALLSTRTDINEELAAVFHFLLEKKQPNPFHHLLVSQFGALENFSSLIDDEISAAQAGRKAHIIVKVNNLEERHLIGKLYEAAEAGVKVEMIVRSICCLRPGTHEIPVTRLVDRYLEHARLFYFHASGEEKLFAGSSDWMNRNLHSRVEVSFPIYDPVIKAELVEILQIQLNDRVSAVKLDAQLNALFYEGGADESRSQLAIYRMVERLGLPKTAEPA